jgi:hypothetical protein
MHGAPQTRDTGYSVSRWDLSLGTVNRLLLIHNNAPPDNEVSALTAKRGASGLKAAVRGLLRVDLRPGKTGGM